MHWLKTATLFFLSLSAVGLTACSDLGEQPIKETAEVPAIPVIETTLNSFFSATQERWDQANLNRLDSLGYKIDSLTDGVDFYPFENDYDNQSFIFSAPTKQALNLFQETSFLSNDQPQKDQGYEVWRKETSGIKVLDFSIEPHPVLHWIFVVRQRSQI